MLHKVEENWIKKGWEASMQNHSRNPTSKTSARHDRLRLGTQIPRAQFSRRSLGLKQPSSCAGAVPPTEYGSGGLSVFGRGGARMGLPLGLGLLGTREGSGAGWRAGRWKQDPPGDRAPRR